MPRNIRLTKKNSPPISGKCDICGERTYLPFQCKRCLGIFCDKHHLPENHSCIPISKIIQEIKQFEEKTLPKSEEEENKNKIDEINRIIATLQTMYESREMGRSEYLDKITYFNREKEELEARPKQLKNIGANSQKGKPAFEKQDNELDNSDHNSKYSYTVDEKYRREYVGDTNKANHSHAVNNFKNDGVEEPIGTKSRCQFCYSPITGIPFKCHRCGLFYCVDHRLPENHWCATRKEYSTKDFIDKTKYSLDSKYNRVKNWLSRGRIKEPRYYQRKPNLNFLIIIIYSIIFISLILASVSTVKFPSEFNYSLNINLPTINFSDMFTLQPEQKNESKEAFAYLNQLRKQNNRRPIEWDDKIYELAVARSKDMYERNYFDHTTPEGKCIKDFKSSYGLDKYIIAENLGAQYVGYSDRDMSFSKTIDVKGQVDGWMGSRGHRYNLMYPDHVKGAIGCYYGVCAFLGAHTDPYGLGAGPCTTGDEGLAYWKSVGKQPDEI